MNLTIQTVMLPFTDVIEESSVLTKGERNLFDKTTQCESSIVHKNPHRDSGMAFGEKIVIFIDEYDQGINSFKTDRRNFVGFFGRLMFSTLKSNPSL